MLEQFVAKCRELEEEFTADFKTIEPPLADAELKQKVMEEIHDELDYPLLAKLEPAEMLQLAREYNALEKPTAHENLVMLSLDTNKHYSTKRAFDNKESMEIALAYAKCAANADLSPYLQHELGNSMKSLVGCHPETARLSLDVLKDYLCNGDVIDAIRVCITRNEKLAEKGFAAIHKNVANMLASDDVVKRESACQHLEIAFRDLYSQYAPKSPEVTDIITENFVLSENIIPRRIQKSMYSTFMEPSHNSFCGLKSHILYDSFKKMDDDPRSFGEIYAEECAKHKEELEQESFKAKVEKRVHRLKKPNKEIAAIMPNSLRYVLINAGPEKPTADKFHRVINGRYMDNYPVPIMDKPSGGLWTSLALQRDENKGQWEEFCDRQYTAWKERNFKGSWHVVPHDDCRVLEYHKIDDIKPYIRKSGYPNGQCTDSEIMEGISFYMNEGRNTQRRKIYVDYKAISRDYDLFIIKDYGIPDHPLFGDLDCDSGVVMDFSKVTVMDNDEYAKFIKQEMKRFSEQLKESGIEIDTLKRPEDVRMNKRIMQAHFAAQKGSDGKK